MNIYFNSIQSRISEQIAGTKESIQLAVAWFTNKELLSYLTEKAANRVAVSVLISDDIINKRLNFDKFKKMGGRLLVSGGTRFLHEKFAVFDTKKLLMGSYNWTYGAEYKNHESVIITAEKLLVDNYAKRFNELWTLATAENITQFKSENSTGFIEQEKILKKLEDELYSEITKTLQFIKKMKLGVNIDLAFDLIDRYGVIGACRKVLERGNDDENIPSGFYKLARAEKIDYTFESIMTLDKYRILFPDKVLKQAEERIKKFSR